MAWHADDGAPESSREGPVVPCGLGRVGQGILALLKRLGERVTVVTLLAEAEAMSSVGDGVRIILGDARDERILAQVGLETARALIAATDHDLDNVMIALHAHQVAPDLPVVARLFDENLADHLRSSVGSPRLFRLDAGRADLRGAALGDSVLTTFEAGGVITDAGTTAPREGINGHQ